MMLGYLLARAGIDVQVLEKHSDFLRDFRGDTVHPSTLELMQELGILKEFLARPHQEVTQLGGQFGDQYVMIADFSRLKNVHCKFIAFMPQWDFLDFLSEKASKYPGFHLRMNTEVTDVIEENGKIVGVTATSRSAGAPHGTSAEQLNIRAALTVGCDGRASTIRQRAGMTVRDVGAPMDILWMRLSRKETDPPQTLGRVAPGVLLVMLNREDYWQCGFVIPKGQLDELKQLGIEAFRQRIVSIAPFTADRVQELQTWDDIKLLTVKVDRLEQWYRDGLLCIGDAAHAMSPVGGVGINLAIQDAVATANILHEPLKNGTCTTADLEKVQQRRLYPTRMTQRFQVAIQNNAIKPTLGSADTKVSIPPAVRLFQMFPALRAIPANLIGLGFRPEHIEL